MSQENSTRHDDTCNNVQFSRRKDDFKADPCSKDESGNTLSLYCLGNTVKAKCLELPKCANWEAHAQCVKSELYTLGNYSLHCIRSASSIQPLSGPSPCFDIWPFVDPIEPRCTVFSLSDIYSTRRVIKHGC